MQDLQLRIDANSRLCLIKGQRSIPVRPVACFPWSEPKGQVSLRDDAENEIAFVADLGSLGRASRDALEQALEQVRFVFEIERIVSIKDEFELRAWVVETKQGKRAFQTKLDAWPRPVHRGGMLIRDLAGDLYLVRAPDRLDARSRKLFWAFCE